MSAPIFTDVESLKDFLQPKREAWPIKGFSGALGIARGCFDLMHAGHANHLRDAKEHCGILVAGIIPDSCVAHRKGAGRPIESQAVRAQKVAQSPDVDAVLMIGEGETDSHKIWQPVFETLRPNLVFCGDDGKVTTPLPEGSQDCALPTTRFTSTTQMITDVTERNERPR